MFGKPLNRLQWSGPGLFSSNVAPESDGVLSSLELPMGCAVRQNHRCNDGFCLWFFSPEALPEMVSRNMLLLYFNET